MTTPSEHPHDDLAVLALDALGPQEREGIEAHVRGCPACQAELDDYRATLALVAPEEPIPPASTWERIAGQVAASSNGHRRASDGSSDRDGDGDGPGSGNGSSPAGPSSRVAAAPTAERGSGPIGLVTPPGPQRPTPADAAGSPDPSGPRPTRPPAGGPAARHPAGGPAARHRARPRRSPAVRRLTTQVRRPIVAAAAAAATVAVALGVGIGLRGSGPGPDDEVLAAARRALEAPDASVAELVGPEGQVIAEVVVDGDEGYALVESLSSLPEGRGYQLWSLDGTEATSLGTVGDGTTRAVAVEPAGDDGTTRLAITEEPAGGVDAPTGPTVATGSFA